ncbi:MAG: DUF1553 domain-containing protein, partial [Verrucomicrobiales bacterium]|nr:DUF1553 domain-containing protein [Verrucomicrobiales bacterium]
FDPIPTRDYYRLYSAFSATQPAELHAAFLPGENRRGFEENRALVEKLHNYADDDRKRLVEVRETAARAWYTKNNLPYKTLQERKNDPDDQKPPRHVGLDHTAEGTLKVREQDEWIWGRRKERFEPMAQAVYNGPDYKYNAKKLRKTDKKHGSWNGVDNILTGGSIEAKGEKVKPGTLSAVAPEAALPESLDGRRLALARWMASPDNTLTTRSIVNRVWAGHFGSGIVATPNNFGVKGAKPTHPELLDHLTRDFVENGWSIKRLHKTILTSATYQRATRHPDMQQLRNDDPNNELLAYFEPRRLTAEEIRDTLLAVSGELNPEMGGLPVHPEINQEVALQPRMIQFSIAPAFQASQRPDQRNRRSIYTYRVRGQADPFLEIFNQPNPNRSCEARDTASVSPQAFTLLNSDVMTDRSIALALRLQKEETATPQQVRRAFHLLFGRQPSATELENLTSYTSEMVGYHNGTKPGPTTYPTEITRSLVEEFSGKPFEYTEKLFAYEDYTPDAKPDTVSPETRALADTCLLLLNTNEFMFLY